MGVCNRVSVTNRESQIIGLTIVFMIKHNWNNWPFQDEITKWKHNMPHSEVQHAGIYRITCFRYLCFFSHTSSQKNSQSQSWTTWMSCEKKIRLGRCRRPVVEMDQIETGKNSTFNKLQHVPYRLYISSHGLLGSIYSFFLGSKMLQLSDFCGEFSWRWVLVSVGS